MSITEIKEQNKEDLTSSLKDFLKMLVWVIIIALFIMEFVVRFAVVNQTSMMTTLESGDRLLISNLFYEPKRSDIIVFCDPDIDGGKPLVKRIIGLAGDTVTFNNGKVTVNGESLIEDYVYCDSVDFHEAVSITVPNGCVFVMGDHRNVSLDSRNFGAVPVKSILGHVLLRITPFEKFGKVE